MASRTEAQKVRRTELHEKFSPAAAQAAATLTAAHITDYDYLDGARTMNIFWKLYDQILDYMIAEVLDEDGA